MIISLIVPVSIYAKNDLDSIETIERDLIKLNTSVENELNKSINEYESILNNSSLTGNEIDKINELILSLKDQLQEYRLYKSLSAHEIRAVSTVSLRGSAAVTAVIAWFNAKGYKLSAELLSYARRNDNVNAYYTPIYGSLVKKSSVYWKLLGSNLNSGTGVFTKSGSKEEIDLYYSIHKFKWYKTGSGKLNISDVYDFDKNNNYDTIAGVAISEMYKAQENGIIVPFNVSITI